MANTQSTEEFRALLILKKTQQKFLCCVVLCCFVLFFFFFYFIKIFSLVCAKPVKVERKKYFTKACACINFMDNIKEAIMYSSTKRNISFLQEVTKLRFKIRYSVNNLNTAHLVCF